MPHVLLTLMFQLTTSLLKRRALFLLISWDMQMKTTEQKKRDSKVQGKHVILPQRGTKMSRVNTIPWTLTDAHLSGHICPDAAWHLPYSSIPLSPPSQKVLLTFSKRSRPPGPGLVALQLQICAAFTSARCFFGWLGGFLHGPGRSTPRLIFQRQISRIQSYYCGREQSQHTISITWFRQPISVTDTGF